MTQNTVEFMRKYADLISETASQQDLNDIEAQDREHEIGNDYDEVQEMRRLSGMTLDEGMMDTVKQYASKLTKALDPATLKQIAATVKQATGGDYSLTKDNAQKVAQALGAPEGQMSEGISPTLGGKIAQALHLAAIAAAIPLGPATGGISVFIGFLALMFAKTFWGNEAGELGSEYEMVGDPLTHAEIRPIKGITPKRPVSTAGGIPGVGNTGSAEF